MKAILIVGALVWVSAAVTTPDFAVRRRAPKSSLRRTGLPQLLDNSKLDSLLVDNSTHSEYTSNWAGAVMIGSRPE